MKTRSPKLKDGSEWADHEDCIVGDETGLRNLMSACETALENGEYYGSDLGDYVGVKKLEPRWFEAPNDSPSTRLANTALTVVLIGFLVLTLIGGYSVYKWIF